MRNLPPQACERCGEVHDSLEYTFFYGSKTSEMTVGRTRTTHYTIAGSRQVRLCDHCVADYYMAYHRKIALIMLGIAVGSAVLGGALVVGFILAALLLLVVFYFLFYWIKGGLMQHKQGQALRAAVQTERGVEMGDELAKSIYGKTLKLKGFDSFFTRSEYKKLEVKRVRLAP